MVRVFQEARESTASESLWSFSYIDWQGKERTGVGTDSRFETQRLAERVQAEHNLLRKKMRPKTDKALTPSMEVPEIWEQEELGEEVSSAEDAPLDAAPEPTNGKRRVRRRTSPRAGQLIGDQLVEANVISREQLDEALQHQREFGGRIIDVLIQLGHLTAEDFLVFMGNRPGVPRVILGNYTWLPKEVLQLIPAKMAAELEVIPIDRLGTTVSLAMVCPVDAEALDRIQKHTGLKARPFLCSRSEFRKALRLHYGKDAIPTRK